ncbi:MAG: F0F1 ATP synthase subunit A [Clostridia bacterium]|nr:F0F1 ATP synthase subunit A [Clostridia bacterium]
MTKKNRSFIALDVLLIVLTLLPIVAVLILKVLTNVPSEGISITGARVFFTLPLPLGGLPITESQINSAAVILSLFFLCLYMTHGIAERPNTRRQLLVEWVVEKTESMVSDSMGSFFAGYAPFIAAILALSALSSLMSLFGLYPPTSDINIVAGWAILVFILITYYKLKGGLGNYLKGFTEPIFIMTPLNILGEVATPVSMAFRHYGNVLSGSVIAVLIAAALQGLSSLLLGWLPGVFGEIPFLQIGLPAILSLYFDLFSGCMQAYIFAMLTMLNISGGFPEDEYERRRQKKLLKKQQKTKTND